MRIVHLLVRRTVFFSSLAGFACSPGPGADSGEDSSDATDDPSDGDSTDDASGQDGSGQDATDDTSDGSDDGDEGGDSGTDTDTGTDDGGIQVWPLKVDAWEILPQQTHYVCFEFTTTFDRLAHIVGFVPKIDNTAHVHHYVLELMQEPSGMTGYPCYSTEGQMLWGWAPGVTEMWLPEEAGFLVGDQASGEVTLRLQIHYNNPLEVSGQVDSSGLDVHYTHDLRPNHAGVLTFGAIEQISIPAGDPAYEFVGTCNQTASILDGPVHVFGASLHAHQIGSVLWTDVFRDGEFLYELNRDDPFAFEQQNFKELDVELRPGDVVVNHCVYDASERDSVTRGGVASTDEMCWDTIAYYPKSSTNIDYCSLE